MALANSSQCGRMAASLASLEALVWFSIVSFLKYCGGRKSLVSVGTVSCGIVICCRQGEIEPYGHVCIVFFNWMFLASISKLSLLHKATYDCCTSNGEGNCFCEGVGWLSQVKHCLLVPKAAAMSCGWKEFPTADRLVYAVHRWEEA